MNNTRPNCCEIVQRTGLPCQLRANSMHGRCGKHKRCNARIYASKRRCKRDIYSTVTNFCWQHSQQLCDIRQRILESEAYSQLSTLLGDNLALRERILDECTRFLMDRQNTDHNDNMNKSDSSKQRRKSGYIYAFTSAIDDSLVKIGMTTQLPAKRIGQQVCTDGPLYRHDPETGVFPARNCRLAESMIHYVLKQCRLHVRDPSNIFHGDQMMASSTEWFQLTDWLRQLIQVCTAAATIV